MADRTVVKLNPRASEEYPLANSGSLMLSSPPNDPTTIPFVKPPSGAVLHPPTTAETEPRTWFLFQLAREFQLIARMYFDPRYRISRTAQFAVPAVLSLFVFNYFLFSIWFSLPIASPIAERVGCVFLSVFFYKLMIRELARYRAVLDYLATYGHH